MADNTKLAREVGSKNQISASQARPKPRIACALLRYESGVSRPCGTRDAQSHTEHIATHLRWAGYYTYRTLAD